MIEVHVKTILGMIDLVGGHGEQKIQVQEDSNVLDLINQLTVYYGDSFKEKLFDESGKVRFGIAMFINGRNIFALEGLETKLNPEDEFLIFPPVGGG